MEVPTFYVDLVIQLTLLQNGIRFLSNFQPWKTKNRDYFNEARTGEGGTTCFN
jgi:hypothetical protein